MMDRVYSNSVCNLAATGYGDGKQGILSNNQLNCSPPYCFRIDRGSKCSYLVPRLQWVEDVVNAPLHRRGWMLQEQIMVRIFDIAALILTAETDSKGLLE